MIPPNPFERPSAPNPFERPAPPNPFDRPASPHPFERAGALEGRHVTEAPEEDAAPAVDEAVPERHEDVIARVRELLGKYPTLGSRQLFDLAVRMHPDLEHAGFRSFHARYVLPLKREKARAEGRMTRPRATKSTLKRSRRSRTSHVEEAAAPAAHTTVDTPQARGRVRVVLLRLARQIAVADSRADLVDALAGVEDMVEEVLRAVQPPQSEAAPDAQDYPLE